MYLLFYDSLNLNSTLTDRATVLNFCDHVAQATSTLADLNLSLLNCTSREDITEVLLYAMKSLSDAYAMAISSPCDLLKVPDSVVIASLEVQRRQMQEVCRQMADELDVARRQYTSTFDSLKKAQELITRLQSKVEALDESARVAAARDAMVESLQHERNKNLYQISTLRDKVRKLNKLTKYLIGELASRHIPINIPKELTFDF